MRWQPILLALIATACGPVPKEPSAESPKEKPKPPVEEVKTSSTEITVASEKGDGAYIVRAKESVIKVTADGPEYGKLNGVDGDVRKDGKVVSHFSAKSGLVDRSKQILLLDGSVKITGNLENAKDSQITEDIELTANRVRYDQTLKRYEADGNVMVVSASMSLGPIPKLYANSDLNRFGTPGKFK